MAWRPLTIGQEKISSFFLEWLKSPVDTIVMQLELVSHRPPFPELAGQALPHEIASAALELKQQPKQKQKQAPAHAKADAAHSPEPEPNPKQEAAPIAI